MQETELPTNPEATDTDIPEIPPPDPNVPDPEEQAGSPAIMDEERRNDPERTETDIPDTALDPDGAEEEERPADRTK